MSSTTEAESATIEHWTRELQDNAPSLDNHDAAVLGIVVAEQVAALVARAREEGARDARRAFLTELQAMKRRTLTMPMAPLQAKYREAVAAILDDLHKYFKPEPEAAA
jgi:hypothetical protein